GKCPAENIDGALAHRVVQEGAGDAGRCRGDVDDPTALWQTGQRPLNDEKRRFDVDLEAALKYVWRQRLERGAVEDAGVVDQDVEGLVVERCVELSKERVDLGLDAVHSELGVDREGVPARGFDRLDRIPSLRLACAVVDGDDSAVTGQALGDRPSDAA